MTKLPKFLLAALGGATVLMLAVPADAAIGRSTFRASVDEIRRYCERLDESFWRQKRWYGCGDKISCKGGTCKVVERRPPPDLPTPGIYPEGGKGNGGDHGAKSGGNNNGGGSSSSAGAN